MALRDSTTTALPPATERPPVDAPPPPPPPGVGDTYAPRHEDAVIRDLGPGPT
ncbi:MAG: hypothetical protein H6730_08440 [Deltaproteobacteria bacterium]|nr:hypothetical protein [Deltaproteobacteria bacterium]